MTRSQRILHLSGETWPVLQGGICPITRLQRTLLLFGPALVPVRALCTFLLAGLAACLCITAARTPTACDEPLEPSALADPRRPSSDEDLRYWLQNMVWYHRFSLEEISAATGMTAEEVAAALDRLEIRPEGRPQRAAGASLTVLPYPGGRHPRIGFLEGALRPQRETKVSVFTPWDENSYVVVDVPEAIWSNLGLTYLAHTHVETIWTRQGIELERLEWTRNKDGSLEIERRLPNGICFGTRVVPAADAVHMRMWLVNGTEKPLSDLRVQLCAMLRGAAGFEQQTNENKHFEPPYACARDAQGRRWIIMAWVPNHRTWGNERCPCLHSDPQFPDCLPGETVEVRGWLSFYEGDDLRGELARIERTRWWEKQP